MAEDKHVERSKVEPAEPAAAAGPANPEVEVEESEKKEAEKGLNTKGIRMITAPAMPRRPGQELDGSDGCFVMHEQVKHETWDDEQQRKEKLVIDSCAYHNVCNTGFAAEFPLIPIRHGQSTRRGSALWSSCGRRVH